MKEMIKKVRERREGFTMAELLIVVAIIAVLVAIAIPVFTSQLERSRDAVTVSNIRAAYAQAQTALLTQQSDTTNTVNPTTYTAKDATNNSGNPTVKVEHVVAKGENSTTAWSGTIDDLVIKSMVETGCAVMDSTAGNYSLLFKYDANGNLTAVTATAEK